MRHHRRLLRRLRDLCVARGYALKARTQRLSDGDHVATLTPVAAPDRVTYSRRPRRLEAIRDLFVIVEEYGDDPPPYWRAQPPKGDPAP